MSAGEVVRRGILAPQNREKSAACMTIGARLATGPTRGADLPFEHIHR